MTPGMSGTVVMLSFGYASEQSLINPRVGFAVGICGWAFILAEVFIVNPAGKEAGEHVASAFNTVRFIATIGWSIYPLEYHIGYLMPTVSSNVLNLVYNLADMLNKCYFCLAICHAAKCDTAANEIKALLA